MRLTYEPHDDVEIQMSADRRSAIIIVRITHAVELAIETSTTKLNRLAHQIHDLVAHP
jgi:hypothetical protein